MYDSEINCLNAEILNAHNKHYEMNKDGLICINEQPNSNIIYHLYSTGEYTFQKGGWAYLKRSEFTISNKLPYYNKLSFKFANNLDDSSITYVILTEQECIHYINKMGELITKIMIR